MFAVIYRAVVKPTHEQQYQQLWQQVAQYFIKERGALGSCLHKTHEGLWLAYSRWPDRQTRDASWPEGEAISSALPRDIAKAILALKVCLVDQLPEITMDVVDDLLVTH